MVMNFDMRLNSTTFLIFIVVTFYWAKVALVLFLSQMEELLLESKYSRTKYIWNYYTEDEFEEYRRKAKSLVGYKIYYAFHEALMILGIVILEVFHALWQLSETLATKYRLRDESSICLLYLLILRYAFHAAYLPVQFQELKVTRQAFVEFLVSLFWMYIAEFFLIIIFAIPAFHLVKHFSQSIIFVGSAAYFLWTMASAAMNFNFFTTLEPLEDGILKKTLVEKILPEIGFSIDNIYHSDEELGEKVYISNTWFQKNLLITGPLPVKSNVSLIGDAQGPVQYTFDEVIALIAFRIGNSSEGYNFSILSSTVVHLFFLTLVCWHMYNKQYVLHMAGFRTNRPVIANLLVVWYFVIQPYWALAYCRWTFIYDYTQLTEAQFMVSHFNLQRELINALIKVYQSNKRFPYHHFWYAIFNGYPRPLYTLVLSLSPPDVS